MDATTAQDVIAQPTFPKIVLAGPGSGKSTTLAKLARNLSLKEAVAQQEIVVASFSRAAAERARGLLCAYGVVKANVMTCDAFAYRLVKSSLHKFPFSAVHQGDARLSIQSDNFGALGDKIDHLSAPHTPTDDIVKYMAEGVQIEEKEIIEALQEASKSRGLGLDRGRAIQSAIQAAGEVTASLIYLQRRTGKDAWRGGFFDFWREIYNTCKDDSILGEDAPKILLQIFYHLDALKDRALPLGGIKINGLVAQQIDPETSEAIAKQHYCLLLDEFQDFSLSEYTLLSHSALTGRQDREFRVAVFGDPFQTIFQFKGALGAGAYRLALIDSLIARGGQGCDYAGVVDKFDRIESQQAADQLVYQLIKEGVIQFMTENKRTPHERLRELQIRMLGMMQKPTESNSALERAILSSYVKMLGKAARPSQQSGKSYYPPFVKASPDPRKSSDRRAALFKIGGLSLKEQAAGIGNIIAALIKESKGKISSVGVISQNIDFLNSLELQILLSHDLQVCPHPKSLLRGKTYQMLVATCDLILNPDPPLSSLITFCEHILNTASPSTGNTPQNRGLIRRISQAVISSGGEPATEDGRGIVETLADFLGQGEFDNHAGAQAVLLGLKRLRDVQKYWDEFNERIQRAEADGSLKEEEVKQMYEDFRAEIHRFFELAPISAADLLAEEIRQNSPGQRFEGDEEMALRNIRSTLHDLIHQAFVSGDEEGSGSPARIIYESRGDLALTAFTGSNEAPAGRVQCLRPFAAKGLEYDVAIIFGLDDLAASAVDKPEAKNLAYVLASRARHGILALTSRSLEAMQGAGLNNPYAMLANLLEGMDEIGAQSIRNPTSPDAKISRWIAAVSGNQAESADAAMTSEKTRMSVRKIFAQAQRGMMM